MENDKPIPVSRYYGDKHRRTTEKAFEADSRAELRKSEREANRAANIVLGGILAAIFVILCMIAGISGYQG